MPEQTLVAAVALKDFSNTICGNVSVGDKLNILQDRFNVWKAQGLVGHADPSDNEPEVKASVEVVKQETVKNTAKKPKKKQGFMDGLRGRGK